MPDSEDISTMGVLKVKGTVCNHVRGAFMKDGVECNTTLDARGSNTDWANERVELTLEYGNNATSTLKIKEYNGVVTRNSALANLGITGIAAPTENQHAANKKYTDDTLADIINIHEHVIQRCGTALPTPSYAADGKTFTFTSDSLGWTFADGVSVTYTVQGAAIVIRQANVNDRVLITNATGSGSNKINGVYVLTTVNSAGLATMTRATDLDDKDKLMKGEMVLVVSGNQGTAIDEGIGFILSNNVTSIADSGGTAQEWIEHHAIGLQEFAIPLFLSSTNVCTCQGATDGTQFGLPLVGAASGVDEGRAAFSNSVGKTGNIFKVNCSAFTLTDLGVTALNATNQTDFVAGAGAVSLAASTSIQFNLETANPTTNPGIFTAVGKTNVFSQVAAGTTPVTSEPAVRIGLVEVAGHITCRGAGITDQTEQSGAGVLFDSVAAYTTANLNTFLIAPHSTTTANVADLAIWKYAAGGAGSVLASWTAAP